MTLGTVAVVGTTAVAATVMTGGLAGPAAVAGTVASGLATANAAAAGAAAAGAAGATAAGAAAAGSAAAGATALATGGGAVAGGIAASGGVAGIAVQAGLAGAALGPLGVLAFCFDGKTAIQLADTTTIKFASDIQVGDKVEAFDIIKRQKNDTLVSAKHVIEGEFNGKLIRLDHPEHTLKVTDEHMMIYIDSNETKVLIKPAKNLAVGDIMLSKNGNFAVKSIEDIVIKNKVNIETESGLIIANGIFTSGFCENVYLTSNDARVVIDEYIRTHFIQKQTLSKNTRIHKHAVSIKN